jgi:dTDP-4-dehydrorhamnose 3,5-epimerase
MTFTSHADERGSFTEVFREEWAVGLRPVQWNLVRSRAGTLRGVHVHSRHSDYLMLVEGRMTVCLRDLRPGGEASAMAVEFEAPRVQALFIPPGVAHGFYYPVDSVHVYAVSRYFDPADDLGCRWDDPELGMPWPETPRQVSARDRALPGLAELRGALARAPQA